MIQRVNCHADFRFRAKAKTPNTKGELATPTTAGAVTGLKLRLSETATGAAIHSTVNDLAATEETGEVGTFYYVADKALLEARILPLGLGKTFYAIWYKTGDADHYYEPFLVADRSRIL